MGEEELEALSKDDFCPLCHRPERCKGLAVSEPCLHYNNLNRMTMELAIRIEARTNVRGETCWLGGIQ